MIQFLTRKGFFLVYMHRIGKVETDKFVVNGIGKGHTLLESRVTVELIIKNIISTMLTNAGA